MCYSGTSAAVYGDQCAAKLSKFQQGQDRFQLGSDADQKKSEPTQISSIFLIGLFLLHSQSLLNPSFTISFTG